MAELRATKRNPLLGLLADALSPVADYLSTSTNPLEDTGSDLSVTGLLGDTIRPVANTVNRMSYGEPLTTGRGMTTQLRPDTRDALLAVSPMGAGTKAAGRGVKAGAQALSPQAERMLMDTMRKMGGIKDITAYHGSPHTFDKFSLDKIGTGEGAQVYGHGLYFADSPDVATEYRKALSQGLDRPVEIDGVPTDSKVAKQIAERFIRPESYIEQMGKKLENLKTQLPTKDKADELGIGLSDYDIAQIEIKEIEQGLQEAQNLIGKSIGKGETGNLYKVDIPDEAVANMLLWDKPLSEQPEAVRRSLQNAISLMPEERRQLFKEYPLQDFQQGKDIKEMIGERLLKQAGIPGIRYLDQGSRGAGSGTMNTVLFDDALVKILERNGVPMQGLLD